jgi:hypothetical protein
MNIFVLDLDPELAAQQLCDKHVPKMVLETAQLLCSVWPPGEAPYKRTHYNHPCAKWTRASIDNFLWLLSYGEAISREYALRFGREHASAAVIAWCAAHVDELLEVLPDVGVTQFAQAMPSRYKVPGDPVAAYRRYYLGEKERFCKWERGRRGPSWFKVASPDS